jgi:hypothetical protein
VGGVVELRQLLEKGGDDARRVEKAVDWLLASLPAEGVALLTQDEAVPGSLGARCARGSLIASAPLLAIELARAGVPAAQGLIHLSFGGAAEAFLCIPIPSTGGKPRSALVLHGQAVEEAAQTRGADVSGICSLIGGELEKERKRGTRDRGLLLGEALAAGASAGDGVPGLTFLTEGLRLPLYTCDLRGRFRWASQGFLDLTAHPSLEALAARGDFFLDPASRADELETVRSLGSVTSYPLAATSGRGGRLDIRDSAVLFGEMIVGVFFDVTALLAANAELKDTLQVQELLNDSILAGTKTLQRTQGAAIRSLARLAEYRDPETGFHLQRICEYTRLLALQVHERSPYSFHITREYGDDISISSMLHDIGKVSIPDSILLKEGPLDPNEWERMKKHTVFGWEVLHKADRELGEQSFLTLAATIALSHHERFDGKGYPQGNAGEQIPLSARISAISDVYDALTSPRPYKEAWSHERAVEEILSQGAAHFDPVLIEIFREVNGEFAEVRRQFPG